MSNFFRFSFSYLLLSLFLLLLAQNGLVIECGMSSAEKNELKNKVLQMFDHAFNSYMTYAYPADELMPLSCKGRYRHKDTLRGDIDEVLGNYTLTLVDSLDTLALLGRIDEFEQAVKNVIATTHFDRDLVVSVFESNIRMVGGLLSGHVSLIYLNTRKFPNRFKWYNGELLDKAKDLAYRLLPAFNTSTGLPMPRVNLKYGITRELAMSDKDKSTCTACAGTLLLEFVLLSRLTGEKVFEEKVMRTMDYLWDKRNRNSDLVGTVINVNDGEWLNKDASIGAGIDSYYEYLFKGYILMGDETLLYRFNKHYSSITKYMSLTPENYDSHGSSMRTVHMHMPNRQARNYIDALLAFWPGLQVLKGDLRQAIRFHEELHQIVRKYDYFMPEAVLFDHSAHWANHPLRPEFLESTYYLYKSTHDSHYLEIGKRVITQFEKYSRVPCGYAAIADVKTKQHEDRMDSFVFAETFKYLYLLFAEDDELVFDVDEFLFSTEAHLLPLNMMDYVDERINNINEKINLDKLNQQSFKSGYLDLSVSTWKDRTCPSLTYLLTPEVARPHMSEIHEATRVLRDSISSSHEKKCTNPSHPSLDPLSPSPSSGGGSFNFKLATGDHSNPDKFKQLPLRAHEFNSGRTDHIAIINRMGISMTTISDGRVQLVHKTTEAASFEDAELGILFMTDMLEFSKSQKLKAASSSSEDEYKPMHVIPLTSELKSYLGGPSQFGYVLRSRVGVFGKLALAEPIDACGKQLSQTNAHDKILIAKRGNCIFVEKARLAQKAGALGLIIVDNADDTSYATSPLFSMSGDGTDDVRIPSVFLFSKEGNELIWQMRAQPELVVFMGDASNRAGLSGVEYALNYNTAQLRLVLGLDRHKSCARSEVFWKPLRTRCFARELQELRQFYALFDPTLDANDHDVDEDNDGQIIQITTIGDVIVIKSKSNAPNVLDIDLATVEKEVRETPGQDLAGVGDLDSSAYLVKVFDNLLSRFVKQTNFMKLPGTERFTKTLYNYVSWTLNPKRANFDVADRANWAELAQLLKAASST